MNMNITTKNSPKDNLLQNGDGSMIITSGDKRATFNDIIDSIDTNKIVLTDKQFDRFLDKFSEMSLERLLKNDNLKKLYESLSKSIYESAELAVNEYMLDKCNNPISKEELKVELTDEIINHLDNMLKKSSPILAGPGIVRNFNSSDGTCFIAVDHHYLESEIKRIYKETLQKNINNI